MSSFSVICVIAVGELITDEPSWSTASRALLGFGRERKTAPPCFSFATEVKFCQISSSTFQSEYGSFNFGGAFQSEDILNGYEILV